MRPGLVRALLYERNVNGGLRTRLEVGDPRHVTGAFFRCSGVRPKVHAQDRAVDIPLERLRSLRPRAPFHEPAP
jgi:hypothetical protein